MRDRQTRARTSRSPEEPGGAERDEMKERIIVWLAWKLYRDLVYWCFVRVATEHCGGNPNDRTCGEASRSWKGDIEMTQAGTLGFIGVPEDCSFEFKTPAAAKNEEGGEWGHGAGKPVVEPVEIPASQEYLAEYAMANGITIEQAEKIHGGVDTTPSEGSD